MARVHRENQLPIARNVIVPSEKNLGISTLVNKNINVKDDDDESKFQIDCVLTYKDGSNATIDDIEVTDTHQLNKRKARENFQNFLKNTQGLRLRERISLKDKTIFVHISTPFDTLLLTAENIRMKLPIEKIDEKTKKPSDATEKPLDKTNELSRWQKFKNKIMKPFRLDLSFIEKTEVDYYTAVYSSSIKKFDELFDTLRGSREKYFTPTDRTLLTYELLCRANSDDHPVEKLQARRGKKEHHQSKYTEGKGIDQLRTNGSYISYFPLHEPLRDDFKDTPIDKLNNREKLRRYWATFRMFYKNQPIDLVRSYMGEQVAFYFAVSDFYTQMLIPAAIVGLIVFIYSVIGASTDPIVSDICGDFGETTYMCPVCDRICPFEKLSKSCIYSQVSAVFDNVTTIIFAALMCLWTRWFIEMWKRREAELQYEWDSIDFVEQNEPIRPEYKHQAKKTRLNPITEIEEPDIPLKKRYYLLSFIVVFVMILIACVNVFGTIAFRIQITYLLNNTTMKAYASIIITISSAVINLIVSLALSKIYYLVARRLTNHECHKYQSQYDKSFTIKIYLFEFVNSYSSIFYIAFFKGRFRNYPSTYGEVNAKNYNEQCDPTGCLVELSIQFFIIMTGKQAIKLLLQLITATYRTIKTACKNCGKVRPRQTQWEIDSELNNFESNTLLDEYMNIIIQFGFVTLFATAFPLAPLFALINNIIELRLDAWKFLSKYKRPIPFKAADIGIWNNVLSGVSYFALLTNAVIIAWTSEFIPKMAYRITQTDGRSLVGYVNWTLSSFPIADYNLTNTLGLNVPTNVTYCRYRDFRESTGPNYSPTVLYWNILVARLAFVLVFEHLIFFIVYFIQWFIPDVPKEIQEKIKRERFLDQRERWSSKKTQDRLKSAVKLTKTLPQIDENPTNQEVSFNIDETNLQRRASRK